MTTSDWLMILAVLLAPVIAVQVQQRLDVLRETRRRKTVVFQTLMATRAARISPAHVQALNSIDIEFGGSGTFPLKGPTRLEKAVIDSWREYHDHLSTNYDASQFQTWVEKGNELFTNLLHEMAKSLGYGFDRVQLKRGIYTPVAHGAFEEDQRVIRKSLVDILSGQRAIPIQVHPQVDAVGHPDPQAHLVETLVGVLEGKRAIAVRFVEQNGNTSGVDRPELALARDDNDAVPRSIAG
ncbi:MAG: hypothetical protein HY287_07195 [Planctomycetes bacterium]|nr:hypothetical protein [Planctomycetota bacterium]